VVGQRKHDYFFDIAPLSDLRLSGQVVIALAHGVEIFVCLGFDRTFRATCIVLPSCTGLYKQGLTVHDLSLAHDGIIGTPDGYRGLGQSSGEPFEFYGLSCAEGSIESSGDLNRIGVHLKMDMDFHEQFQILVRLDEEKFRQYYFPGQSDANPWATVSEKTSGKTPLLSRTRSTSPGNDCSGGHNFGLNSSSGSLQAQLDGLSRHVIGYSDAISRLVDIT